MSALDLPLNLSHLLLLSASALGAGALNAIAGGGSFLTFPALVWTGLPPIVANATSAVAVSPGYLGSALGFRRELAELPAARRHAEALICCLLMPLTENFVGLSTANVMPSGADTTTGWLKPRLNSSCCGLLKMTR